MRIVATSRVKSFFFHLKDAIPETLKRALSLNNGPLFPQHRIALQLFARLQLIFIIHIISH